MPRITNTKPPAPHPAAAAVPAANQKQPLQAPHRPEEQTENASTTNRSPRMTPFKKGFEMDTEKELAHAFNRPPRMFKEDSPFYPWLPRMTPIVNFQLKLQILGLQCSLSGVCLIKFAPPKKL